MRIKGGQLLGNRNLQGSHDADAREHRGAARRRDQDQRLHCCLPLRSLMLGLRQLGYVFAGISRVTSWRLRGSDIGSSNLRFHPRRSATDGLAQLLHREFDVLRLEMAPAFYLGLELLLEVSLEIFPYRLPGRPSAPS